MTENSTIFLRLLIHQYLPTLTLSVWVTTQRWVFCFFLINADIRLLSQTRSVSFPRTVNHMIPEAPRKPGSVWSLPPLVWLTDTTRPDLTPAEETTGEGCGCNPLQHSTDFPLLCRSSLTIATHMLATVRPSVVWEGLPGRQRIDFKILLLQSQALRSIQTPQVVWGRFTHCLQNRNQTMWSSF